MTAPRKRLLPFMGRPCYFLVEAGHLVALGNGPVGNTAWLMMRMEAARDGLEVVKLLRSSAGWLGSVDRPLWLDYLTWTKEVLVPLRFPDLDLDHFNDLVEGVDMLAERMREWAEEEGRRHFHQGERELLCKQAARRFGDPAASRLLAFLGEPPSDSRIALASDLVLACRTAEEFRKRLESGV